MESFYELLAFVKSADFHTMSVAIIGPVKLIRSALGTVKGKYALALTLGVSTVVGVFLFADEIGLMTSAIAGLASGIEGAGAFWLAKKAGKKVNLNKQ